MLLSESFSELKNVFQHEFNKILSQQSTKVRFFLSHNRIKRTELKNKGPKHTHLAMFWIFCVGWRHYVNKILDWSKLKQIADDILKCIWNVTQVPYSVENIVWKGEIAFLTMFSTVIYLYCVKMRHCVVMG